jgi:hypothetical protein
MLFLMTSADEGILREPEGLGWRTTLLMGVACLIGLADIFLVTIGNTPVTPRLTQSEYVLVPIVERSSGDPEGTTSALLSTSFTMRVPKSLKAQKVEITRVAFFSETDAPLGSARVSDVTVVPTGGLPLMSTIPTASGDAVIPPLNEGEISFRATLRDTSQLAPGTKIYSQVEGTAGNTYFRARSRPSAATGGEA